MTRYRKKPVEVEALVYDGAVPFWEAVRAIAEFIGEERPLQLVQPDSMAWEAPSWPIRIWIAKSQAWGRVEVGDAVIRESDGSGYYPCAKAVFEATYEPVED